MKITDRAMELKSLIGNTPLLTIRLKYKGEPRVIYAKAESLNMTGSIKDRMAYHIICNGYSKGTLSPGMPIYEATSGNTGISGGSDWPGIRAPGPYFHAGLDECRADQSDQKHGGQNQVGEQGGRRISRQYTNG
jgi:hypothetical protein